MLRTVCTVGMLNDTLMRIVFRLLNIFDSISNFNICLVSKTIKKYKMNLKRSAVEV